MSWYSDINTTKRFSDEYNLKLWNIKRTHKWFPTKSFGDDLINNTLFHDLLTSEQNILTTDQTCGMFGVRADPYFYTIICKIHNECKGYR